MMFCMQSDPIQIDSRAIPEDFLEGFRDRQCAMLDCRECGYCQAIADKAVRMEPAFQERSLRQYREMEEAMAGGGLWGE